MHVLELEFFATSPIGQSMQLADPVLAVNVPSLHPSQADCPSESWYFPAAHSEHDALPAVAAYLPCSQLPQLLCPDAGCALPIGQSVQELDPVAF